MLAELDLVLSALLAVAAVVGDASAPALILLNPLHLTSKAGRGAGACILPMLPQLA